MAEGASNKTIARRLEISVHTVKFHVGSLLDKLDAAGRTDAVAHAARLASSISDNLAAFNAPFEVRFRGLLRGSSPRELDVAQHLKLQHRFPLYQ